MEPSNRLAPLPMPATMPQTPLMQQFWEIKSQNLDKILLYRMGDFYEMFFDDAVKAAPILNIALTSRNKSQGLDVPMCGVPHHSIGPQINKLLKYGLKVAICDQIENPKDAKGIVKRAVTRVVTPGLVYDPETLDSTKSNFVAAVLKEGESTFHFAALEASTGEIFIAENLSRGELSQWVLKLEPHEFVVLAKDHLPFETSVIITVRPALVTPPQATNVLKAPYEYLLQYAQETQGADLRLTLRPPQELQKNYLKISATTVRHLELFKRMDGETEFSLFWAVDLTRTPMGARLLRKRLASPFATLEEVMAAQTQTRFFVGESGLREKLRARLTEVGDLERKVARLSNPLCNARDLRALALALSSTCEILEQVNQPTPLAQARSFFQHILKTFQDELPHSVKEGGLIKPGFNSALDEYVDLSTHAQTKLSELEAQEKQKTGISSLKVKYNSVFGYSFEVTKANLDKVPSHFVRRQTLAQGERFVTAELSELEQKILSAQSKRCELEYQVFVEHKQLVLKEAVFLLALSSQIAELDLTLSWAQLAVEQNYGAPTFCRLASAATREYQQIRLKDARHPVIEKNLRLQAGQTFVPNDIDLISGHCLLLTGPNMAGKSTLMRQVALIAILAQCGSYVPAVSAELPLFDSIYTRIGASDNLAQGLSTFMVEMTETAEIIRNATENSLVILDEIGRGTSTYDGMSLAQSVLEYFLSNIRSYTFFATHYHELTELARSHKEITNGHMSIKEHRGELIFLRKLKPGPANRSYGIDVAKQAGLPIAVTQRAQNILRGLATKSVELAQKQLNLFATPVEGEGREANAGAPGLFCGSDTILSEAPFLPDEAEQVPQGPVIFRELQDFLKEFHELSINTLTPIEALNTLSSFQKSLQSLEVEKIIQ